ncbi:MAG: helix-turn-helix domain-containing protein [Prevotellaceae bacterium]|jgi:AraC-like DNA-binding protein|nr:helix-turn-helix domain-containing protein [Prevotellaceae bacterium]
MSPNSTATNYSIFPAVEKTEELQHSILHYIEVEKVYLDATLSLKSFSHLLDTNTTYLSRVINKQFGCNLKSLLNGCRINYAKTLLAVPGTVNVSKVATACGFTSRSNFYKVVKEHEELTPTEFRQQSIETDIIVHQSKEAS